MGRIASVVCFLIGLSFSIDAVLAMMIFNTPHQEQALWAIAAGVWYVLSALLEKMYNDDRDKDNPVEL